MRKKVIKIILIIIVILGMAITSFAVYKAKILQFTSDGKVIFFPGETDISDVLKGTRMVIAVTEKDESTQVDIDKRRQEVKKQIDENKEKNMTPTKKNYEIKKEDIEDNSFYQVLLKYNDTQEVLELIQDVMVEDNELHVVGEEKEIKPSAKKMYNFVIEMMERKDVEENDKRILQEEYLDYVDNDVIEKQK